MFLLSETVFYFLSSSGLNAEYTCKGITEFCLLTVVGICQITFRGLKLQKFYLSLVDIVSSTLKILNTELLETGLSIIGGNLFVL